MKKTFLIILAIAGLILAHVMAASANHGYSHGGHYSGGHFRGSIWVGPGWLWPPYYPYYPYYYPYYPQPPLIIHEQQPELYLQQAPQTEAPSYWYYCPEPQGYYPYVKQCPKGWLKVVPSPPAPERKEEAP
jgi:hypothetical protein